MIQTIRDAESKIWALQKEVTYFKTKINELENKLNDLLNSQNDSQTPETTEINDWIPNADGSQINHRVAHNFQDVTIQNLDVNSLDAMSIETQKLHITEILGNKNGGYLIADDEWVILSCGAEYNGTIWIARAAKAFILSCNPKTSDALLMYCNTGLTPGTGFTPTQIASISNLGDITAKSAALQNLSVVNAVTSMTITTLTSTTANINTANITNLNVSSAVTLSSLTVTGNVSIGGTLGVTGDSTFQTVYTNGYLNTNSRIIANDYVIVNKAIDMNSAGAGAYLAIKGIVYANTLPGKSGTITAGATFTNGIWTGP